METAIQDEYRARETYAKVLSDLGDMTPFLNVVAAEGQHVDAVGALFTTRRLDVPLSEWDETNVPTYESRRLACVAGAEGEAATVAMYDALLLEHLADDVRTVFENVRLAALEHHLPAFEECAADEPEPPEPPDPEMVAGMETAIQDEYRARETYAKVLADLGDLTPFLNIVSSEGQHVDAVAGLFLSRDLDVPASEWDETNVPVFESRALACAAAAEGEAATVAMYDDLLLADDLPDDVRTVYESVRLAALESHLPAFEQCAADEPEPPEPPDPGMIADMETAIQDEYRARETYAKVLADLGDLTPFLNIVSSEGQHIDAVAGLFLSRDLDVPASEWDATNVPVFESRALACAAAAEGEAATVAMYDALLLLAEDLPDDVRTVFGNVRRAALEDHLPAFQNCS
jgi:hypothetical protein